eukprot:11201741-Lingulodinium_polyedra.AAC.1
MRHQVCIWVSFSGRSFGNVSPLGRAWHHKPKLDSDRQSHGLRFKVHGLRFKAHELPWAKVEAPWAEVPLLWARFAAPWAKVPGRHYRPS